MLAALLATSIVLAQDTRTVALSNGAVVAVGGESLRYWGCADTFLSSITPDMNFGGSHILEGGPGKVILIKFGDLDRIAARKRKVVKATLFLTPSSDLKGKLTSAKKILVAWGEGPETSPFAVPNPLAKAPALSATWKARRAGAQEVSWYAQGAAGASDASPIAGATMADNGKEIAITGIQDAVQQMLDRDFDNRGFALTFSGPVEFFSSENRMGKPRLELELANAPEPTGSDLSVVSIDMDFSPPASADKPWPKEGEQVTYTAHVKNVGTEPAPGFSAAWIVDDKPRSSFEIKRGILPGEEVTVPMTRPYKGSAGDHRVNPVGLAISPSGPDATQSNNALQIYPNAIPVELTFAKSTLEELGKGVNFRGSRSAEDAMQGYITLLNEIVLPKSRFSFAPDGAVERFRIAKISGIEKESDKGAVEALSNGTSDRVWHAAFKAAGLISYDKMNRSAEAGATPNRVNGLDRYPGLLGGGATLDEIGVPGEIQLPYEPFFSPIFSQIPLEGTGLLAAADVAALNANLGSALGGAKTLNKLPSTVLVRALTFAEKPLQNATLTFYQSNEGLVSETPAFTVQTSEDGVALIPSRDGANGKRDVFGGLEPDGGNGVYRIKAEFKGTTDSTWLKAWQLADSFTRSGHEAVIYVLRFNLPSEEVDRTANLAKNRIVTDSADDLPAKLTGLVDDNLAKDISLPNVPDSWVEIDLGRDRPIAEINLVGASPEFWKSFDVVTYSTGMTARNAQPWFHSLEPTFLPAGEAAGGAKTLSLRGVARLMRYVRFVCKEPGAAARLSEIQVYPAKPPAP